jgi:hypothetical protein
MKTGAASPKVAQQSRKLLTPTRPEPTTEHTTEELENSNPPPRPYVKRKRQDAPSGDVDTATTLSAKTLSGDNEAHEMSPRLSKKQKTAPIASLYADEAVMQDAAGDKNDMYAPHAQEDMPTIETVKQKDRAAVQDVANDENTKSSKSKAPSSPKKVYTDEDVKVFQDGIKNLNDWSSETTEGKFIDFIIWIDVQGLSIRDCAMKWVEKGYAQKAKTAITETAMYKSYNNHAPVFYAEKGLLWVPRDRCKSYNKMMREAVAKAARASKQSRTLATPAVSSAIPAPLPVPSSTLDIHDVLPASSGKPTHVSQTAQPQKKKRGRKPKANAPKPAPETEETRKAQLLREQDRRLEQLISNNAGPAEVSFIIKSKGKM